MSKPQNIENIKNIIPKPITPVIKPPMYRSIFTNAVKNMHKTNLGCHQTMGYAKVQLNPPSKFLKKYSKKMTKSNFVGKNIRHAHACTAAIYYTYNFCHVLSHVIQKKLSPCTM